MDTMSYSPQLAADVPGEAVPAQKTIIVSESPKLHEPLRLVLLALGLGFGADMLFRGGGIVPGINVLLIVLLLLLILGFIGLREGKTPQRRTVALFVPPLLFFSAMVAVRASASLTFYNILASGILILLLIYFWSDGNPFAVSLGGWFALPWRASGGVLVTIPTVLKGASGQISLEGERRERLAAIGRGVLFALPVLSIFTVLFTNADAVFAHRIQEAADFLLPKNWEEQVGRIGWIVAITVLIAGGIAFALTRREKQGVLVAPPRLLLGITESSIVLGTLVFLFGTFLWSQMAYLFGGDARVQSVPNLTYADYARHGFAELNVVALLTLVLVGGLKAITKRETITQVQTFSTLATGLMLLTLPLLASAFARMSAYEAAYGATELRLYVDVFMLWLAVGLCWCCTTLWFAVRGGFGLYICAIGFLASLNLINPDRNIAHRNIIRYQKTGRIDTEYLASLSEDALPELSLLEPISVTTTEVTHRLQERTKLHAKTPSYQAFGAWNLSRSQTYKANP